MKEERFNLVNVAEMPKPQHDFNKMRVGRKILSNDVTANFDFYLKNSGRIYKHEDINRAMEHGDLDTLRDISNHYYRTSGIYARLVDYLATMYKYDWLITPWVLDETKAKAKEEQLVKNFIEALSLFDNSLLKQTFRDISTKVILDGVYYGYKLEQADRVNLQELPIKYCRSRYEVNGLPVVEFNVKFFDDTFRDAEYRARLLKMFPEEFSKGYAQFLKGRAEKDFSGDDAGWILLDPKKAVQFKLNRGLYPKFIAVIPAIMDLEDAKDMDKKKMAQQLVRLIVQQMPIDNKGDLIFDLVEAQQLHNLAVDMVGNAIGVDVLTTFADVRVEDMSDRGSTISGADQLEKVERGVFNEAGVSQKQFNTDGTTALEKSIANDESVMSGLLLQFQAYLNSLLDSINNKNRKKYILKASLLPTTIYNYERLAKIYKEETMIGYSKMLPAVALGHSQGEVLMTMKFENKVLKLDDLLIPPQSSATRSDKPGEGGQDNKSAGKQPSKLPSGNKGGRPSLPDDEKSEKTLKNIESQG